MFWTLVLGLLVTRWSHQTRFISAFPARRLVSAKSKTKK